VAGTRAGRMLDAAPEPSVVLVPGPWRHGEISANGQRFHTVEHGDRDAPTVLLLHGFPQFWWAMRHQLVALGEAGWHAVAIDLRGYGASDKPPRGYDGPTLTADIAGIIRALGKGKAVVVGHDWVGSLGWWLAATAPHLVRAFVPVSAAHPLTHRSAVLHLGRGQMSASSYFWRFQMPRADGWVTDDDADEVSRMLHGWSPPGWVTDEADHRYRQAIQITGAAHCALEYYRWMVRSQARPSGVRWSRQTARPVTVPVLQVHGSADTSVLASTARLSTRYVTGDLTWHCYDRVGHFVPEEAPDRLSADIRDWLGKP
jgi:pimeloyl-ACP methyl ester carboxylesterase